jgi:hypothetical protein
VVFFDTFDHPKITIFWYLILIISATITIQTKPFRNHKKTFTRHIIGILSFFEVQFLDDNFRYFQSGIFENSQIVDEKKKIFKIETPIETKF